MAQWGSLWDPDDDDEDEGEAWKRDADRPSDAHQDWRARMREYVSGAFTSSHERSVGPTLKLVFAKLFTTERQLFTICRLRANHFCFSVARRRSA